MGELRLGAIFLQNTLLNGGKKELLIVQPMKKLSRCVKTFKKQLSFEIKA